MALNATLKQTAAQDIGQRSKKDISEKIKVARHFKVWVTGFSLLLASGGGSFLGRLVTAAAASCIFWTAAIERV